MSPLRKPPSAASAATSFYAAFRPLFQQVGRWCTGIPFETCPQQPPVEFTNLLVGHRSDGLVWVCGSHPRRNVLLSAKVEHLRKPSGLRREDMESTGEIGMLCVQSQGCVTYVIVSLWNAE